MRSFQPPKAGSTPAAAAKSATTQTAAPAPVAKRRPDFDLVSCDSEFVEMEKVDKEIKGEVRSVSRRIGAIWMGTPSEQYPKPGNPFVRLGEEGSDVQLIAKLYKDEETEDGAMHTLRLVQKVGKKNMPVKGKAGVLAKVWWGAGRKPEFTFTEQFAEIWGDGAPGFAIGFSKDKPQGNS